jgi:broad specificity phosphatase PhoE
LAKKRYNASILPKRLTLVRHGQSAGNVIEDLYSKMPDNAVPLTDLGWKQAKLAGETLRESILNYDETVHFIISPYVRTMETFHGILSAWCDPNEHPSFRHMADTEERRQAWYSHLKSCHGITWHEDSRIREQDFGYYQNPQIIQQCKEERDKFGLFYYRFPHGESATDVYDRVSTFLDSLWRSFDTARSQNCILVTHGISIRVFLARYFRYSVDQFHELVNPNNCEMFVLEHDGSGMLRPAGRYELVKKRSTNSTTSDEPILKPKFTLDDENTPSEAPSTVSEAQSTGHYEFHKELRTWPETVMKSKRRAIRISPKSVASDC